MNYNNKKGQPQQMFQYMTTLIVIGLIVLLGFKLIGSVINRSDQIDYVKFQRTVTNSISAVAADYNAKQEIDLSVPKGIRTICFIDRTKAAIQTDYSIINNYWNDVQYMSQSDTKIPRNVFLIGDTVDASFTVDKLEVNYPGYHLCIDTKRSRINFWVEGKGKKVYVSDS